jgi:NADH-quinone oxidoreductase subunit A
MLRSYLPALVFVGLGAVLGAFFACANSLLGPKPRTRRSRGEPFECGLPSESRVGVRASIHFYLVALLFLVFDVEVILLWPIAVQIHDAGVHGLLAVGIFFLVLTVAFIYEWGRGTLDWDVGARPEARPQRPSRSGPQRQ